MLTRLALEAGADDVEETDRVPNLESFILGSGIDLLDNSNSFMSEGYRLLPVWNSHGHDIRMA